MLTLCKVCDQKDDACGWDCPKLLKAEMTIKFAIIRGEPIPVRCDK